jgi:hypothetical protein
MHAEDIDDLIFMNSFRKYELSYSPEKWDVSFDEPLV